MDQFGIKFLANRSGLPTDPLARAAVFEAETRDGAVMTARAIYRMIGRPGPERDSGRLRVCEENRAHVSHLPVTTAGDAIIALLDTDNGIDPIMCRVVGTNMWVVAGGGLP
jgi:hypothetical protein